MLEKQITIVYTGSTFKHVVYLPQSSPKNFRLILNIAKSIDNSFTLRKNKAGSVRRMAILLSIDGAVLRGFSLLV
jgi:hypothetical protein